MVSIFSTGYANNKEIKSFKDKSLSDFDKSLNTVLKNLAKSVADGGCLKFVIIKVKNVYEIEVKNLFLNCKLSISKNSLSRQRS